MVAAITLTIIDNTKWAKPKQAIPIHLFLTFVPQLLGGVVSIVPNTSDIRILKTGYIAPMPRQATTPRPKTILLLPYMYPNILFIVDFLFVAYFATFYFSSFLFFVLTLSYSLLYFVT